ncbi:MAG: hypothetical protein MUF34_10680 [Polyangiaceae bacterium]|nr:hypothetical protein [Polyangiaceae bacterium]
MRRGRRAGGALALSLVLFGAACLSRAGGQPEAQSADDAGASAGASGPPSLPEPRASERGAAPKVPKVDQSDDDVMLARAAAATGEQRLVWLDTVVGRKGPRAAEAATLARADRLAKVRRLVEEDAASAALVECERAFPSWEAAWEADREVQALRARVYELASKACTDDPCRFDLFAKAQAAEPTPERAARANQLRKYLVEAFTFNVVEKEPTIERLRRLRALAKLATEAAGVADADLRAQAAVARHFVDTERAKVPLLGNDDGIASELLGPLNSKGPGLAWVELGGVETFLVLDERRKCRGVYAAGKRGARALPSSGSWSAARLLSQAVGQSVTIKKPTTGDGTVRWTQGSTRLVARWREGRLIEARVGDAVP